ARVCVQGTCVDAATDAGTNHDAGSSCTPGCAGKVCGSDGCGGACGTCQTSSCLVCSGGACLSRCTGGQACSAGTCRGADAGTSAGADSGSTGAVDAGSAGAGIIFDSKWDTAVGTSTNAVTDGARWPNYWE